MSLKSIAVLFIFFVCVAIGSDVPTQVHIALAGSDKEGNPSTVAISWNTVNRTLTSTVKYGLKPAAASSYASQSSGKCSSYYETFNHHVVLDTLLPSTTYYYTVGDDLAGWSVEFSFKSAPLSSEVRGNFTFAVFSDLGLTNGVPTSNYVKTISDDIVLVLHGGDVGYADDSFLHAGCETSFCYEQTFDNYMITNEPWTSKIPYMVAPGNHEADCHDPACLSDRQRRNKLSNFTAYNGRFRMPSEESNGVMNMFYSFNYANMHIVSLDTETDYPDAPEETSYVLPCGGFGDQLTWLENDLIKANTERELRPWILAQGHHPMYTDGSVNTALQAAVEDLFFKYGVDIYFAGHEHSYERDYPVYKGVVEKQDSSSFYANPQATTHLLIGGAGNDEMHHIQTPKDPALKWMGRDSDPSPKQRPMTPVSGGDSWTVVTDQDDHVGVGKVTVLDDSHLVFEYVRTITDGGEVFDSFTLQRDHSIYGPQGRKSLQ